MLFEEKRFILFATMNATILILVIWLLNLADIRTAGSTGWFLLVSFFIIGLLSLHFAEQLFNMQDLTHTAELNILAAVVAIVLTNLTYSISIISIPTMLFIAFMIPSVTYLARKILIRG
ncbi:hypothetical protein HY570_03085 [Candidatus Micrarchaeota archaeon]|nr:hypothetical protein [Candidatus Micrarchaeota archaeon]